MNHPTLMLAGALFVTSIYASGCAELAPWQRGNLAKPHMAVDPNPAQHAMRTHLHVSREAASGGDSSAGGGGGCN